MTGQEQSPTPSSTILQPRHGLSGTCECAHQLAKPSSNFQQLPDHGWGVSMAQTAHAHAAEDCNAESHY